MSNDKKLNLTIRTATSTKAEHFNVESTMTVGELRTLALQRFGITPAPGQQWRLKRSNGATLDNDAQTLAQAGLKDKDELILGADDILGAHAR